jgi:hypothetical protein
LPGTEPSSWLREKRPMKSRTIATAIRKRLLREPSDGDRSSALNTKLRMLQSKVKEMVSRACVNIAHFRRVMSCHTPQMIVAENSSTPSSRLRKQPARI